MRIEVLVVAAAASLALHGCAQGSSDTTDVTTSAPTTTTPTTTTSTTTTTTTSYDPDAPLQGAIRHRSTGKFLRCGKNKCTFEDSVEQLFTQVPGRDGQSKFKILRTDGSATGMCLDREHCHQDTSNARESDCDHCGAVHWHYSRVDGRLAEDHSNNCIQDDGSIAHCGWKNAPVEFVPPPGCTVNQVQGRWKYQYTVSSATTETWKEGTTKTHEQSKTKEWSLSVSAEMQQGWDFMGAEGHVKIGMEVGTKTSQTYSDAWSQNEEHEFKVTFGKDAVGKAAWQFFFTFRDSCGHEENTLIHEFALTENEARAPCCVPGFSTDAPTYLTCLEGAMLEDDARCKLAPRDIVASNATIVV